MLTTQSLFFKRLDQFLFWLAPQKKAQWLSQIVFDSAKQGLNLGPGVSVIWGIQEPNLNIKSFLFHTPFSVTFSISNTFSALKQWPKAFHGILKGCQWFLTAGIHRGEAGLHTTKINCAQLSKRGDVSAKVTVKASLEFAAKRGTKSLCIKLPWLSLISRF